MIERSELLLADSEITSRVSDVDYIYRISEEFERDSRRYNRAFSDEQEVSTN